MPETISLYEEAQIVLAGIRLFMRREKRFPSLKELAEFTLFSDESAHHICNRLEKLGAVVRIRGAFDERLGLGEPLEAEVLRGEDDSPSIDEDLQRWKEQQESTIQGVEERFSEDYGKKEKEDFFSGLEDKIRKGGREERESPLDSLFQKGLGEKNDK